MKPTVPAPATASLPLANTILAGRHLPASLIEPALHPLADANAPNLPFWNVASQLNVPGSATVSLKVIAPVAGLRLPACAAKALSGGAIVRGAATVLLIVAELELDEDEPDAGCCGSGGGTGRTVTLWLVDGPLEPVSASSGVIVTV